MLLERGTESWEPMRGTGTGKWKMGTKPNSNPSPISNFILNLGFVPILHFFVPCARSPFPFVVTSYIFIWKVDLPVYSCKARMYLPHVLFFTNFVSDCIAGYMICTSRKIRFTNIIIVVIIINIIIIIIIIIISCLYPMLNKPVKTKQLFLTRPLVCSTVHFLLNWFFLERHSSQSSA